MPKLYVLGRFSILLAWFAATIGLLFPAATAAANFTYDTRVVYRVEADDSVSVTQNYTVTNNTATQYLTQLSLTTPSDNVTNLVVKYGDGSAIPASLSRRNTTRGDIHYDYQEISISFPRQLYGLSRTWKFSVTYTAGGLVDSKGGGHTVYVPSIEAGDAGDNYIATVDVPASFGTAHFPGAQSASGGTENGRQFFNFNKADIVAKSLALAFGDATIYRLNFKFPLHNDGAYAKIMTITLPPDMNNQKVLINSLRPAPINTRLDGDGNVLADYRVKAHERLTIDTDIAIQTKYYEYDLSASRGKGEIPADLVAAYTKPTSYWPTTGEVAKAAASVSRDNVPVVENVRAMYGYVVEKLSYNNDKIKFNVRQGASKALANPNNAVCLEYTDLLVAMLRSQGIPARMAVGYAYSGSLKNSPSVSDSLHSWAEAYIPGIGWMTLDPTWGEKFEEFGKSDLDHAAFAVWGEDDRGPVAVSARDKDLGYQYDNADISFSSSGASTPAGSEVHGRRFVILPFVALDRVQVTNQSAAPSDRNQLTIDSQKMELGSLAPSQKMTIHHLSLGGGWLRRSSLSFGHTMDGDVAVLARATGPLSFLPLLIISGLALIVIITLIVVRFSNRKAAEYYTDTEPQSEPEPPA